jgi:dolichol-phosphate mannosyltransferase
MPKLSIVVPVYFNEANLPDTVPQLLALQARLPGYELELVFVEDGSRDRSLEILLDFHKREPERVRVVKLTRNFGSMAAIQAGFRQVTGHCIGVIAADLQDPPELFVEMVRHWERGIKTVLAVREDREETVTTRWFAAAYYALMRRFAIPDYPKGGFDFLLVDRQVVEEVNRIAEKNTNVVSLIFWLGYPAMLIPYVRRRRAKGHSRWTLTKKIKLVIDSFVAFSYVPIRFVSLMGLVFAASAFVYGGIVFYAWWASNIEVKGWTALMILLTFTAGVEMAMLGLLGEYLWRTLDEVRKRPTYVIDRIYG